LGQPERVERSSAFGPRARSGRNMSSSTSALLTYPLCVAGPVFFALSLLCCGSSRQLLSTLRALLISFLAVDFSTGLAVAFGSEIFYVFLGVLRCSGDARWLSVTYVAFVVCELCRMRSPGGSRRGGVCGRWESGVVNWCEGAETQSSRIGASARVGTWNDEAMCRVEHGP
jgi:hypothetical protein